MASGKQEGKKKLVKTSSSRTGESRKSGNANSKSDEPMLFEKKHYLLIGFALLCITLGMIMMLGGRQASPDVWDESVIYSVRRLVIAPAFIITGLVIGIVAIFRK